MLSCRHVAERADSYLDRELPLWQRARIRLHLAMCHGCSRLVGQMRKTRALADSAARAERADALSDGDQQKVTAILSRLNDNRNAGG